MFITPIKTANSVPTFIENTLYCVTSPIMAQYQPLPCREADTCVLFFYIRDPITAAIAGGGLSPRERTISRISQKRGVGIPPTGRRPESANPTCPTLRTVSHFDARSAASRENKGNRAR